MTAVALPYSASDPLVPAAASLPQTAQCAAGARHDAENLELRLITDRAGFEAIEREWNDLFERAGRPAQVFQTYNWNWHWCQHYLAGEGETDGPALAIVTGRRNGRLVMLWPLVKERVAGLIQLSWMGEPVSQYGDVVMEDGPHSLADLRQAWDLIKTEIKPDLVRLRKCRSDTAIAPLIAEIGAHSTERLVAPCLDLASAPSYEAYEQRYSGGARRNRRRQMRRLAEQGPVAFEEAREGARARELALTALRLKRAWLKERGLVSPALADSRATEFFADVAEGKGRPTGCRIATLRADGEPAAIEIAFGSKGHKCLHIIVYDVKREKSGAGILLMEHCFRAALAGGFHTYDLLAPGDAYKLDWADASVEVNDWAIPLSMMGRAYASIYLGFVRPQLKKGLTDLPTSWRQRLSTAYAHA